MRLYPWLAGLLIGALAASTGCGGGGGSTGAATGKLSVLLTDAPLLAVNGRQFSELNVDIQSFSAKNARVPGFTPMTLVNGATTVNLLDLNNDQEWLAVADLPVGEYDAFQLTIDTATAHLIENNASHTRQDLVMHPGNVNGTMTIGLIPPLRITTATAQHLVVIDWQANQSVHFEASSGDYVLAGRFAAFTANRASAPIPFRALPGRLASVDTATGEMRLRLDRQNSALYLVRTSNTTVFEDLQGAALTVADFAAGDFVVVTGTVDGNTDIDATRVRLLPAPNALPPGGPGGGNTGGGHSGPGGGGNSGPGGGGNSGPGGGGNGGPSGGNGAVAGAVFAVGAVSQLDLTANTFVLSTGRGPITVTYSDAGGASATEIMDATVQPPQHSNENALVSTSNNSSVIVEVAGKYVAPTSAGALPTIDATKSSGPPGRIAVIRR